MRFTDLRLQDYTAFLDLYNSSFPHDGHRAFRDEKELAEFIRMRHGKFHILTLTDGEGEEKGSLTVGDDTPMLGFLTYWIFEGYVYIEHMAAKDEKHSHRVMEELLRHLIKSTDGNILAEIENPDSEKGQQQQKFLERNNFLPRRDFTYMRPPFGNEQKRVPVLLMSHGDVHLNDKHDLIPMLNEIFRNEGASE